MPTVVAMPQLNGSSEPMSQSNYNPNDTANRGLSNFSNFMLGLGQGMKQYQDKNAAADQALGEIDAINGVTRDVGFLNKKNYNQGQQYGAVVQDHTKKDIQFKQQLDDMLMNNPDATPDDVAKLATEYSRNEVTTLFQNSKNITDPKLLADMYQQIPKFYASRLAAGQKALQAAAAQRTVNISKTSIADMIQYTNQDTYTADEFAIKYDTTYKQLYNNYIAAGKTPIEADNAAQGDLLSGFKTIKELAKLDPTSDSAIKWTANMSTALTHMLSDPRVPPEVKTTLMGVVDDLRGSVQKENGSFTDINTQQFILNKLSNPKTMETSAEEVQAYVGTLTDQANSGKIKWSDAAQSINKVTTAFSEFQARKVSMKPSQAQIAEMSFREAAFNYGTSAQEYSEAKLNSLNAQYPNNPTAAAYKAIAIANSGSQYMPELVKMAGVQAYREFGGILKMTPQQFAQAKDGQYKADQFNTFKNVYREQVQQGSPAADDMLAMLPDDVRERVKENILTNGSIGDLQMQLSSPIEYATKSANFDAQVSGANWKNMGMTKYWGGNSYATSGHFWGRKPTDTEVMKDALAQSYTDVYKNDKSLFVNSTTTKDSGNIMTNLSSRGLLINSPNGYAATAINNDKRQLIMQAVGRDGATDYILGHTIDLYKEQFAGRQKVDAKNVVAHSVGYGANGSMAFDVYNKDGTQLIASYKVDMHSLVNQTKQNMQQYKQDIRSKAIVHQPTGFDGAANLDPILINKGGYFARDVTVLEGFGTGVKHQVNIPNTVTVPYNGNVTLGLEVIRHLNLYEGWHNGIKQVKGDNTYTAGQQVLVQDRNGRRNKYYAMFQQAKTPQDIMNVQGQFMADNLGKLQPAARSIGIPVATSGTYPKDYVQFQMLLTDAVWLGGNGGLSQVTNAFKTSQNAQQAIAKVQGTSYWNNMQPNRREWFKRTVNNYYAMKQAGYIR